jgi:hypothetical protein
MAVEPPARPPPCPRDRIENHGHRRSDRRQSPQRFEKHRASDGRGEGGVVSECSAARADRAGDGGARRGRAGFPVVAGGALDGAGAAGQPRGATRGDGGARGLADAPRLAGGGEALQPRRALGPGVLAASRAADRHSTRGLCQPGLSSRARAPGARSVGSGRRQAVAAAGRPARHNRIRERNPISGRPARHDRLRERNPISGCRAGPEPVGVFAARVAARAGRRRKSAKAIKIHLRPAGIAANSARPARAVASSGISDGWGRLEARPQARSRRSASARSRARAIAARRRASTAKARCR